MFVSFVSLVPFHVFFLFFVFHFLLLRFIWAGMHWRRAWTSQLYVFGVSSLQSWWSTMVWEHSLILGNEDRSVLSLGLARMNFLWKNARRTTCFLTSVWSNYSDLTRPIFPKWWFSKGNPLISGKSRLVKYYNLANLYQHPPNGWCEKTLRGYEKIMAPLSHPFGTGPFLRSWDCSEWKKTWTMPIQNKSLRFKSWTYCHVLIWYERKSSNTKSPV